ncbi:hypothetical protein QM012_002858 [Aureobasidium pullulans]|uniref:Uncharacterized protein n=1 Tax=Aureobasidium pullulans TaxID=5580 RepID=A0ABR0TB65_AURPU
MLLLPILLYVCFLAVPAIANVEKTIFTAPDSINFGDARPNLIDLRLDILSSKKLSVRTVLPVIFPTEYQPRGLSSWYILDGLRPGQRYEVRICWAATQPSDFILDTFEISTVFDTPALLQDLSTYADERQNVLIENDPEDFGEWMTTSNRSVLFLRIQSAANFYSTNEALMQSPPPVYVDIILDPYLLNVFPQSLLPTAAYILVLAVASWFLSGFAWSKLQGFSAIQQHPRSFRGLPIELVLEVLSYLAPDAFISFGFANYHLLIRHSLAPLLSQRTMTRLRYQSAVVSRNRSTGPMPVPSEVYLQILRNLEPVDALNYAMANYLELARQGIAPPLSQDTLRRLNRAVRRGLGSGSNT